MNARRNSEQRQTIHTKNCLFFIYFCAKVNTKWDFFCFPVFFCSTYTRDTYTTRKQTPWNKDKTRAIVIVTDCGKWFSTIQNFFCCCALSFYPSLLFSPCSFFPFRYWQKEKKSVCRALLFSLFSFAACNAWRRHWRTTTVHTYTHSKRPYIPTNNWENYTE